MAAAPLFPPDPVDAVMAIMARGFDPRWGEAWNRRQVSDALLLGTCRFALADPDGNPADDAPAFAAGFMLSRGVLDEEELLLIAVDPEHRRRGVGARLLERFVSEARARGARRLFLEMRRGNPAAALYEAHGFRAISVRPAYYRGDEGARIDAVSFERVLD